jgi:uncharacterized protein (TIGR02147 family)
MIFEFDNYRTYLSEFLKKLPKRGYGEARKIAAHLEVGSTFVSQVFHGSKDLSLEQADILADYLGLVGLERDYFILLVEKERAGTKRLKQYWNSKLEELKKSSLKISNRVSHHRTLTDEEKSVFYSSFIYSCIHTYTSTAKRGRSLEEVRNRFELSRSRANEILKFLCDIGLCKENEGYFHVTDHHTHVPKGSPHLLKHHANWRIKAIQYSEELSDEELMYTANISISKKDFQKIRDAIVQLIKTMVNTAQESDPEEIAQFNLDYFWIRK